MISKRRNPILHAVSIAFIAASFVSISAQVAGTQSTATQPPAMNEEVPPASNNYPLTDDSLVHPSVPAGKIFQFEMSDSKIFPDTTRHITVYVPASYKGDKPACVYIALDNLSENSQRTFDNLIAQHAMPTVIGIGVSSGTVASAQTPDNPRFDRSFEFDSMNGRLGHFLLEELIPEVERHRTPDGYAIRISKNSNDRAIGGLSTGAIAAFTIAWEHPDAFHRVFSAIGTYVGMRGGEQYYVLVRKTEPKPVRIFMQDGVHDEWPGGPEMGDWWMSNQTMARALEFAGYDVRHVWGAGTHDGGQAASVFPDAMRWLWRDWPAPVLAGQSSNPVLQRILEPGKGWETAAEDCASTTALAANPAGDVFYDGGKQGIFQIGDPRDVAHCRGSGSGADFAFGADGKVYLAVTERGVNVIARPGYGQKAILLIPKLQVTNLTVRYNGDLYLIAKIAESRTALWLVRATGETIRLADLPSDASGLALSPDGHWLFIGAQSRYGWNYRVLRDGTVDAGEPFYDLEVPAQSSGSGAAAVAMDVDGRAYVATKMGVQVLDRNGRVTAILPLPSNQPATGLCFGGQHFDTLYVSSGGRIYRRELKVRGAPPWASPRQLPPGDAG
jgi:enterochelin esterase-like enzyme